MIVGTGSERKLVVRGSDGRLEEYYLAEHAVLPEDLAFNKPEGMHPEITLVGSDSEVSLSPYSPSPEEAALTAQIDALVSRLDGRVSKESAAMDALLERLTQKAA